jgi:hypothetical protein
MDLLLTSKMFSADFTLLKVFLVGSSSFELTLASNSFGLSLI